MSKKAPARKTGPANSDRRQSERRESDARKADAKKEPVKAAPKAAPKKDAGPASLRSKEDFLLELHCEEIPARFLKLLTEDLAGRLKAWAEAQGLGALGMQVFYSPRKLAWRVLDLPTAQPDRTETQVGPPKRMCVDEAGQPTVTGLKFAEKWNVPFESLTFDLVAGKKEPVAMVVQSLPGRPSLDLLAEALPGLIAQLHVPKAMRWGASEFAFVRPIRNILCLLGEHVVPFEVDGVSSGHTTWGHRLYHRDHSEPITIANPTDYDKHLEEAGVVCAFAERRRRMKDEMEGLAWEVQGEVVKDDGLLDTLAEIVEWPKVIRGEFPADFLELPKEVLVTSLKEHQKAFCVQDAKGNLLPTFITAANRPDDPNGFVKSGNEWVLRARLYDARFFFAEDRKVKLAARMEKLKTLTFQRELGSYADKSARISALATDFASQLGLDAKIAGEAGRLAKADLVTHMVGEFPELQGIMGGEYLKAEGAPQALWMAVKEQYRPMASDDAVPSSDLGALIALTDKLDTLVGCFAVGLIPSGSKDPLALRRAGMGIIRILWEKGWSIKPLDLSKVAFQQVKTKATKGEGETLAALDSFFKDRVSFQLELAGIPPAVRRSAQAVGCHDLADLKARCRALSAFAEDSRFESLGQSAKRIANILKDETPAHKVDENVLQHESERILAAHLLHLEGLIDPQAILEDLAGLVGPLAAFFEGVMVKCEDENLRAARLSLLNRLRQAFLRVADLSQWQ
ncbi:MAG TPA: glycine--tRNA ligase subunit beta [Holophagaceae bacterium]|nr:glycine--tRNA ligase subunit beta [Holophagaceae bacterium]